MYPIRIVLEDQNLFLADNNVGGGTRITLNNSNGKRRSYAEVARPDGVRRSQKIFKKSTTLSQNLNSNSNLNSRDSNRREESGDNTHNGKDVRNSIMTTGQNKTAVLGSNKILQSPIPNSVVSHISESVFAVSHKSESQEGHIQAKGTLSEPSAPEEETGSTDNNSSALPNHDGLIAPIENTDLSEYGASIKRVQSTYSEGIAAPNPTSNPNPVSYLNSNPETVVPETATAKADEGIIDALQNNGDGDGEGDFADWGDVSDAPLAAQEISDSSGEDVEGDSGQEETRGYVPATNQAKPEPFIIGRKLKVL